MISYSSLRCKFPAIGDEGPRLVPGFRRVGPGQLDDDRVVGCRTRDRRRRSAAAPNSRPSASRSRTIRPNWPINDVWVLGRRPSPLKDDGASSMEHRVVGGRYDGVRIVDFGAQLYRAQQAACFAHVLLLLVDHTAMPSVRTFRVEAVVQFLVPDGKGECLHVLTGFHEQIETDVGQNGPISWGRSSLDEDGDIPIRVLARVTARARSIEHDLRDAPGHCLQGPALEFLSDG